MFASADTKNMDKATADDLVEGDPVNFASNTLEIAVPPDNPAKIASFADLAEPGVKVVVCAPQVPCGSATQKVETATGVTLKPVSEESSVTDVLNKVTTGEADAGLVYVTDVKAPATRSPGCLPGVERGRERLPDRGPGGQREHGPGAGVRRPGHRAEGQQVLADAGFAQALTVSAVQTVPGEPS